MSPAVLYAGLVGRYIRMERPATAEERAAGSPGDGWRKQYDAEMR